MRLVPGSLSGRLLAVAAVLIVVVLAVAGAITGLILFRFIQGQVDQRLDAEILALSSALAVGGDGRLALTRPLGTPPFDRAEPGWYFEIFDGENRIRSASLGGGDLAPPAQFGPLDELIPGLDRDRRWQGKPPLHYRTASLSVGGHAVTIVATAPRAAIWRPLLEALSPVLIALVIAAVALVLATFLQVRLGLRPLQALRAAVADVRAGRRDRVPPDQPREISPLVAELNSLIADNAEGLVRARRHVSNLAHGLKTPLATLAVALDEGGRDPDGALHFLVDQMDRRIRHHLGRARAAALNGPARARTPLAARVADLVAIIPRIHPEKTLVVTADIAGNLAVACEPQDVDEMLGNLVDNAGRWAAGRVGISAGAQGADVAILVEDDGPGLAGDQIPEALRPGQKLDESAPGYGFGLPITRELAELYGGGLELGRSVLGGVKATLILPAAR